MLSLRNSTIFWIYYILLASRVVYDVYDMYVIYDMGWDDNEVN